MRSHRMVAHARTNAHTWAEYANEWEKCDSLFRVHTQPIDTLHHQVTEILNEKLPKFDIHHNSALNHFRTMDNVAEAHAEEKSANSSASNTWRLTHLTSCSSCMCICVTATCMCMRICMGSCCLSLTNKSRAKCLTLRWMASYHIDMTIANLEMCSPSRLSWWSSNKNKHRKRKHTSREKRNTWEFDRAERKSESTAVRAIA